MLQSTVFASGQGSLAMAISRELKTRASDKEPKLPITIKNTAKSRGMIKKAVEGKISETALISGVIASTSGTFIRKMSVSDDIIKKNILSVKAVGSNKKRVSTVSSPPSVPLNNKGSPNSSFGSSMMRNADMIMNNIRLDNAIAQYSTSDATTLLKQVILLRLMTAKRSREEKATSEGDLLDAWGLVRDAEDEAAKLQMKDKIVTSLLALHRRLEVIDCTLSDVNIKLR